MLFAYAGGGLSDYFVSSVTPLMMDAHEDESAVSGGDDALVGDDGGGEGRAVCAVERNAHGGGGADGYALGGGADSEGHMAGVADACHTATYAYAGGVDNATGVGTDGYAGYLAVVDVFNVGSILRHA